MAKNIGATLSLKDGNFFANVKSAMSESEKLRKSLNATSKESTSFGDKLKICGSKAVTAAKSIGVFSVGAATAIGAMVTKSASSFAEYEQLVGGVETLFKDSAETVKGYANEAYKTSALDANEYMSTVTSFSASLINSMGGDTEAAAARANMAIEDMSDNANKMGTNMDSIMQTYQSISRGNYGMLDNLKLGYGGTKKEMERLIADAERMRAEMGKPIDYDISSFSDIVSAIHDIQDNMGITGTTSKEAATTISGSFGMLKASWKNVLTSIAGGGADFDKSMDSLVTSAETVGRNLIPVIETSLSGLGNLVTELAPVIAQRLPGLVETVLPELVSATGVFVTSIAEQVPGMAKAAIGAVPGILESILGEKSMSVLSAVSPVIAGIAAAITTYKVAVTAANIVEGIRNGLIAFSAVMTGTQAAAFAPLTTATIAQIAATQALNVVTGAFGAIMTFVTSPIGLVIIAIGAVIAIGVLLYKNWDTIKQKARELWSGIKEKFEGIKNAASEKFNAVKDKIGSVMDTAKSVVFEKLNNIKSAYQENGGGIKGVVFAYMEGVKGFYTAGLTFVDKLTGGKLTAIKDKFISGFNKVKDGVVNALTSIRDKIKSIWDSIKSFFKMPSIEVVGTVSIAGIDTPIPKLGVKWYASGGIMTRPTIFGVNGNKALGGGERGAEAILPLSVLWDKLREFLKPQPALAPATVNHNSITVKVYSNNEDDATLADKVADKILEILDNM